MRDVELVADKLFSIYVSTKWLPYRSQEDLTFVIPFSEYVKYVGEARDKGICATIYKPELVCEHLDKNNLNTVLLISVMELNIVRLREIDLVVANKTYKFTNYKLKMSQKQEELLERYISEVAKYRSRKELLQIVQTRLNFNIENYYGFTKEIDLLCNEIVRTTSAIEIGKVIKEKKQQNKNTSEE